MNIIILGTMLDINAVEISSIEGNRQKLDGGAMFGNAPKPMWSKWVSCDDLNRIELACRALLIEWRGKKILCETGIGRFFAPNLAERFGVFEAGHRLLESLGALGLSDTDIDYLILSHLHFDHAGGLLPAYSDEYLKNDGLPPYLLFPRATYVVGRLAFSRSESPHPRDRASFIPGLANLLKSSSRLFLVDSEPPEELRPIIRFVFTHGHTPGHMHTIVQGRNHNVIFAGDLVPGTAWVHLPITMGYDRFAEQVIDEKSSFFANVVSQDDYLFYTHDSNVAMSRIQRDDKGKYTASETIREPLRHVI